MTPTAKNWFRNVMLLGKTRSPVRPSPAGRSMSSSGRSNSTGSIWRHLRHSGLWLAVCWGRTSGSGGGPGSWSRLSTMGGLVGSVAEKRIGKSRLMFPDCNPSPTVNL